MASRIMSGSCRELQADIQQGVRCVGVLTSGGVTAPSVAVPTESLLVESSVAFAVIRVSRSPSTSSR